MSSDAELLTVSLVRDLSTCTRDELFERWQGPLRTAIEQIHGRPFDKIVPPEHNPIYYVAQNLFFDNVRGDPNFLYAPMHRDIICAATLDYLLGQDSFQDSHLTRPAGVHNNGLLVLTQRDSFKSTFKHGVDPYFCALRAKHIDNKDVCSALIHQKEFQASRNLLRMKRKTRGHPWLKQFWPEFISETDVGTQTDFNWACVDASSPRSEPSILAGGLTADYTGLHFDYVFMSDLVVKEHRLSKHLRDTTESLYDALMYTVDTKKGKVVHDGTFYHQHDLWHKMVRSKQYVVVNIPAGGHGSEPLSHPHRHSKRVLDKMQKREMSKSGNDDLYWMQMQLRVKTERLAATNMAWLRRCPVADVPPDTWRAIFVDGAWKGTHNAGQGDYASIQVWAFERRGSLVFKYLMDGVHSNHLTSLDGESEIFRLMRKYGATDVAIEESGGYAFRANMVNNAATRGMFINPIDLKMKQTNKQQRIVTFLRDVQAGRVFLTKECDPVLISHFLDQYEDFPQCEHDDALDAAAYTCDPNVAASYAPMFNTMAQGRKWNKEPVRRTRHCGV